MANYKIVSHAGAGLPLNVATTTTISRRTNVNIWLLAWGLISR